MLSKKHAIAWRASLMHIERYMRFCWKEVAGFSSPPCRFFVAAIKKKACLFKMDSATSPEGSRRMTKKETPVILRAVAGSHSAEMGRANLAQAVTVLVVHKVLPQSGLKYCFNSDK